MMRRAGRIVRQIVAPAGKHRLTQPPQPPQPTRLAMLRPQLAEVNDIGWCPAEELERLHAYRRDGSRTCWTCRTVTPAGGHG